VPTAEFEATDRGLAVGLRFLPWHRVRRYGWAIDASGETDDGSIANVGPRVRVVFDDDSDAGEEHTIGSDRFEAGPWSVNVLLDELVDATIGRARRRRVYVPWHRVREYERIPVTERGRASADVVSPPRPDA
jgi:hypothetical protein